MGGVETEGEPCGCGFDFIIIIIIIIIIYIYIYIYKTETFKNPTIFHVSIIKKKKIDLKKKNR